MEYNEFVNCVRAEVEKLCGEGDKVYVNSIRKNNSQRHDAIVIRKEVDNASPSIYLNYFFEEYKNGKDIGDIVEDIIKLDMESREKLEFDIEEFFVWDNVKDKVFFRLINKLNNVDILKDVPHKEIYDLAMVFYCTVNMNDYDLATTMIHSIYLEKWGITEDELYERAIHNTRNFHKPVLKSMNEMLVDLLGVTYNDEIEKESVISQFKGDEEWYPMYVLTSDKKLLGSICMAYDDLLHDFGMEHGNFYIIPSSIHELILVPDSEDITPSGLLNMIIDVNDGQLPKEEILSYNLYYYEVELGKIKVINNVKQKIL